MKYRLHGRYGKIEHAGAFTSMREARLRQQKVREWIADARDPRAELARFLTPGMTVREAGDAWVRSRRSIAERTRQEYERRVAKLGADLDVDVDRLTVGDVNGWVDRQKLAASTIAEYVTTLRAILDYAGVDPNPARDRRVELPRRDRAPLVVPPAGDVLAALAHTTRRFRPVLVLIEQTGMRASEACAVRPDKIDTAGRRILVPVSKNGQPRWAPAAPWLVDILEPPWFVNRQTVHNALKAGGVAAGVKPFGPHMLRHRRGSLWNAQGVPPAQAAAWLGHSVQTYLSTYTWVVPTEEIPAHELARLLA